MLRKHLAWILLGLSVALNVAFVGGFVHARYFADPPVPADLRAGPGAGTSAPIPTVSKPGPNPSPQEAARELGLSDGQVRSLRQMLAEQRRHAAPIVRDIAVQRDVLVAELRKDKPDETLVAQTLEQIGALRIQLQKQGVQAALRYSETLPAEQRDRLRRVMVNRAMGQQILPGPRRPVPAERK